MATDSTKLYHKTEVVCFFPGIVYRSHSASFQSNLRETVPLSRHGSLSLSLPDPSILIAFQLFLPSIFLRAFFKSDPLVFLLTYLYKFSILPSFRTFLTTTITVTTVITTTNTSQNHQYLFHSISLPSDFNIPLSSPIISSPIESFNFLLSTVSPPLSQSSSPRHRRATAD